MAAFINELLTIAVLIVLNGLFASLEIAVLTIDRNAVVREAKAGNRNALIVRRFLEDSSQFLATIQIAITLSGFLASATGAAALAQPLAELISASFHPLARYAMGIAVVLVTSAITFITLVLGELVPKRLGMQLPQRISFFLARPVALLAQLLTPVNLLLTWSTNATLKLMGVSLKERRQALTEEDVRRMLKERAKIPKDEIELIGRVFEFGDHLAKEIMVPRTQMITVSSSDTLGETADTMNDSGHSRLPVTGETVDDIVGLVTVKDLLSKIAAGETDVLVSEVMRSVMFFPDTKFTTELLKEMQRARVELVILIDEYGGVAGLVTIEDLVEEIVGEIRDPFDDEEVTIEKVDEGTYMVHGSTDLEAVNSRLGLALDTKTAYETISGYILSELGYIPEPGEELERSEIIYRIESMSDKRIEFVKVIVSKKAQERPAGSEDVQTS